MGKIIYFVRYSNNAASAFHWIDVDNKIQVVGMAAELNRQNERDGGDRKIDKILEVEVLGEYAVKPVFGIHRIDEEKEWKGDENPKPGFRGNDGRTPCIDIRCLDGGGHFKDECPHKDEDTPCEDKRCPVIGPHTTYNCHLIPRCHNLSCDAVASGAAHWTKDCPHKLPRICINTRCGMTASDRHIKCVEHSRKGRLCPDFI